MSKLLMYVAFSQVIYIPSVIHMSSNEYAILSLYKLSVDCHTSSYLHSTSYTSELLSTYVMSKLLNSCHTSSMFISFQSRDIPKAVNEFMSYIQGCQ